MGHDGVASGYSTPISFRRLTGFQLDPRDRGVTACSGVTTPFETHYRLGHPSLLLLKKLCP